MAALVADESTVNMCNHRAEFVAGDAIGAAHHLLSHVGITSCFLSGAGRILFTTIANVHDTFVGYSSEMSGMRKFSAIAILTDDFWRANLRCLHDAVANLKALQRAHKTKRY